eukprot:CAMPEP_0198146362 /NCGR_PEP_ID=MMETSP1443-20131203/29045_1 /TAXON_ID=186043 /ORGANISM="Entomoneis sp., Strain CCMP2396" /LENGTH=356 /DNA_ID=CAMNT_0043810303 /DNA_START=217 /DNA_END=1287 /DNA_ORIENTATION=-
MKFSRTLFSSSLLMAGARAFSPTRPAGIGRNSRSLGINSLATTASRAFSSSPLNANVLKLSDPQGELLDQVDVFIFDCDGVIWRGDSLIPGIPETLEQLRQAGKKCFFVTNNSTKSRAGYKKKFDGLGLNTVPAEEIFSSSFAAAAYLEQTNFKETNKKVYVIGEVGICEELDLIGVPYIGGPADNDKQPDMGPGGKMEIDEDVGAVIVGFDRMVNYYKIQYAQLAINELGAQFIATNLDAVTHLTDAQEWAGNGSMVGAIKGCTGQEPIVVGKPSPLMIDYLETKYGMDRSRICMVGDRLDTDVLFGTENGLKSLLVLSGVTTEEKLLSPENSITPDYYTDTINDFFVESKTAAS